MLAHLLPIQPSRALNLLPSLLGGTCSQTRWVTPTLSTAVIDFFAYKPGKTEIFTGSVHFRGYFEAYGRWLTSFIREKFNFGHFFNNHQSDLYIENLNSTVSLNQHHIHLIYGSQYPLKWTEPVKIQSCLVYRQKNQILRSIIGGVTQRVCKQVLPNNEGRRLSALDGWIGYKWECLASIISLLVVL